jgi:Ca2+-binding EF-hand superfamily protein
MANDRQSFMNLGKVDLIIISATKLSSMTTIDDRLVLVFNDLAKKHRTEKLSLFHTRCAVIRILGVDLSKAALRSILCNHCEWDDSFVDLEALIKLIDAIRDTGSHSAALYASMDRTEKGYISQQDFERSVREVMPRYANNRARINLLFSEFDTYNIGKVPKHAFVQNIS